ncbi:unnamed protein product [Caenorhabditis brenneri]
MSISKCAYCCTTKFQSLMTRVPRAEKQLKKWKKLLGEAFSKKISESKSRPYVCREHFENVTRYRSRFDLPIRVDNLNRNKTRSTSEKENYDNENDDESRLDREEEENVEEYVCDMEEPEEDVEIEDERREEIDYILIDYALLLETILFCRKCSSIDVGYEKQQNHGAHVNLSLWCNNCKNMWTWSSSRSTPNKKSHLVNRDISSACTVTGIPFNKVCTFFKVMHIPCQSKNEHHRFVKKYLSPVIHDEYKQSQEEVLKIVLKEAEKGHSLDLAGDAQWDSPGHSALNCQYVLVDVATNYVVDVEHVKKTENGKFCQ